VTVAFRISEAGTPGSVSIARSSGHAVIDEAAVAAVSRARFPAPPAGMSASQRSYEVPYHFR
jgi:protein TonB